MSKKLFTVALLLGMAVVAFAAVGNRVPADETTPVVGGSVLWKTAPTSGTGWYWAYDNTEATPPITNPLPAMEAWTNIVGTGSKCAPYNDRPYAYILTDSFWYYGHWYKPGDELFLSPDGWISFDQSIEINGAPTPPLAVPPIPVVDAPNELMAALWADYNPTLTAEPSNTNRVWYYFETTTRTLKVQWNAVVSNATPSNNYTFGIYIKMGGQLLLDKMGSCGIIFSRHFINMLYNTCTPNWTADNAKAGIEDQGGTAGILYAGTLANGRVVRYGYKKIFKHDVRAVAWLSPGQVVLRWTEIEPQVMVDNAGTEAEHFPVVLKIYDSDGNEVYSNNVGSYDLMPGASMALKGPCWTPQEFGEEYDKYVIVSLANDECRVNDTVVAPSIVHCDDSIGYDWNFGDASPGTANAWLFPEGTDGLTFYGVSGGLFTGGRHYMEAGSWLPTVYQSKLELFSAATGCGATNKASRVAKVPFVNNPEVGGWNKAVFPGFGIYATGGNPGNIFAGIASDPPGTAYSYGAFTTYGMRTWPAAHACYLGAGPGRGAVISQAGTFYWGSFDGFYSPPNGFYTSDYYTGATELFGHLIFGAFPLSPKPAPPCYFDEPHDLQAYEMTHPAEDWVESGVAITPEIAIANIGRQKEPDAGFFDVKFIAVDEETGDTTFSKTTLINKIGWLGDASDNPDTLYVAIEPWTPQGKCADAEPKGTGPFVNLELIGLVDLGVVGPDEGDHCPYNDTVRRNVVVLLTHDVGVTEIALSPDFDNPPDRYNTGRAVTITATVENFGYNQESNVPVRCEILDKTADPDTLVYHNIQTIVTLDWRGNTLDNPYTAEVIYPVWNTPSENWFTITCKTELAGDMCPDDDFEVQNINSGIGEGLQPLPFALESATPSGVTFTLPTTVNVSVKVYDISGKLVTTLVSGSKNAGRHSVSWNGTDAAGRTVAKGIYLVRMDASSFSATKKVVVY